MISQFSIITCIYITGSSSNNLIGYGAEDAFSPISTWPLFALAELQHFVLAQTALLQERVRQLEGASTPGSFNDEAKDNGTVLPPALHSLMREQELTINMVLSRKSSWTVSMRKILLVVFGQETLAASCAVGRTGKTFPGERITDRNMNVTINSVCAGARRAQKH